MNETKKCKYCQTDIPKKAKVCPNCKKNLKSHGCLAGVSIFLCVIVVCIFIAALSGSKDEISEDISEATAELITLDEFNTIQNGMSYEEVVEIIGSEGEASSTATVGDITTSIYMWKGKGSVGANANVTFIDNKVSAKAQFGLE